MRNLMARSYILYWLTFFHVWPPLRRIHTSKKKSIFDARTFFFVLRSTHVCPAYWIVHLQIKPLMLPRWIVAKSRLLCPLVNKDSNIASVIPTWEAGGGEMGVKFYIRTYLFRSKQSFIHSCEPLFSSRYSHIVMSSFIHSHELIIVILAYYIGQLYIK